MDRKQEDMQFLSLFGICQEACKIIFSWRKIFSQITLTLILPLSFIILAHIEVSDLLLSMIIHNFLITSGLFDFAYVTVLFIFSLYSTSAVVYTIACIYTGREVTFKKLMSIVPKV
ncbi:uncharacterized protein LOC132177568 [Corylus avellana]|uniref:uncharacterized protein LOC132177568 n=1 Tax=Corylus avellana TaxID=13451 RepID=UPI00286C1054|nr:uncharacterized protein LOC132177568 [Corylus avellana]